MANTLDVARWARFLVVPRRPAVLRDDIFFSDFANAAHEKVSGGKKEKKTLYMLLAVMKYLMGS
jgi:hypothetical protein